MFLSVIFAAAELQQPSIISVMRMILSTLIYLLTLRFRGDRSLELEIVSLRHQLGILKRKRRKQPPRITRADRFVWSWIYLAHPPASRLLHIIKPATVRSWQWRTRSFCYGGPPSKGKRGPRPKVNDQLRRLISQMYYENIGWGAGRIHGEFLKLGFDISEQTIRINLPKHRVTPTPGWRTFLQNHKNNSTSGNAFVIAAALSVRLLHAMVIVILETVKIPSRNSLEYNTLELFTGGDSQSLQKLPWLRSIAPDRGYRSGRRECKYGPEKSASPERRVRTRIGADVI
jgi:hypothetical protein